MITNAPVICWGIFKTVLKKPQEMTPEEKIAYYRTHTVYKGMNPVVTKELGKEKER